MLKTLKKILQKKTNPELHGLCRELGVKNYTKKNKSGLVDLLMNNSIQLSFLLLKKWGNRNYKILVLFTGLLTAIIPLIIWRLQEKNNISKKNYEDLNRPYLETKFVISEFDSTGIRYKFIVNNIGKLPAKELTFSLKSPQHLRGSFEGDKRTLAPGEMMEINPVLKISSIDLHDYNSFVLIPSYSVSIGNRQDEFHTFFKFLIPFDKINRGEYIPTDIRRKEGRINLKEFEEYLNKEFPKLYEKRNIRSYEIESGHSYFSLVKLKDTNNNRKKYIFDSGVNLSQDRISLYLNETNDLVFRIIGKNKLPDSIIFRNQEALFKMPWLLNCEYGIGKDFTLLSLYINDSLFVENRIPRRIALSEPNNLRKELRIGSDIKGKNLGFFHIGYFNVQRNITNKNDRFELIKRLEAKRLKWHEYNGLRSTKFVNQIHGIDTLNAQ